MPYLDFRPAYCPLFYSSGDDFQLSLQVEDSLTDLLQSITDYSITLTISYEADTLLTFSIGNGNATIVNSTTIRFAATAAQMAVLANKAYQYAITIEKDDYLRTAARSPFVVARDQHNFAALAPQKIVLESPSLKVILPAGIPGASGSPYLGEIRLFSHTPLPAGWLECSGQEISRTSYAALFAAQGTLWGDGNGSTTFNVPDMRGRTPIGRGQGTGLTSRPLGGYGGTEEVELTENQLAVHSHGANTVSQLRVNPATADSNGPEDGYLASPSSFSIYTEVPGLTESYLNGLSSITEINSTGNSQPHPNMQPWTALIYGIYTSVTTG